MQLNAKIFHKHIVIEDICPSSSFFSISYCVCTPQGFVTKEFHDLHLGVNVKTPPYSDFAKGPRFLNMVMTFVLHLLSHYNSITEPRARFLLPLIKGLIIDFPSHFILSLIDVYKDMVTSDKLIFSSAITRILSIASISYPESPHFSVMCAIDVTTVKRSIA